MVHKVHILFWLHLEGSLCEPISWNYFEIGVDIQRPKSI